MRENTRAQAQVKSIVHPSVRFLPPSSGCAANTTHSAALTPRPLGANPHRFAHSLRSWHTLGP